MYGENCSYENKTDHRSIYMLRTLDSIFVFVLAQETTQKEMALYVKYSDVNEKNGRFSLFFLVNTDSKYVLSQQMTFFRI